MPAVICRGTFTPWIGTPVRPRVDRRPGTPPGYTPGLSPWFIPHGTSPLAHPPWHIPPEQDLRHQAVSSPVTANQTNDNRGLTRVGLIPIEPVKNPAGRTSLRRLMGHWLDRLGLNAGFESGFKSGGWGCMRVWSGTTGRADCPSAVVGFPSTRGIRCARRPDRQGLDVRHGVLGRAAKTVWTRSSDGGGNTESGKSWRSGGSDASFGCEPATGRL